ncbi:MAG TPA: hypothetical protein VG537_03015 [Candidatus Kapabacteria bacterium]|jgi:hypothetical protein|nr:hypothetical protein [Candidatus Kapabacteria bacterium]
MQRKRENVSMSKSKAVSESKIESQKGMNPARESSMHNQYVSRSEEESARNNSAKETLHGASRRATSGRTLGSATKDNRHGVHTDHTTSRRTESRRQGYMGSESKGKQNRKNI